MSKRVKYILIALLAVGMVIETVLIGFGVSNFAKTGADEAFFPAGIGFSVIFVCVLLAVYYFKKKKLKDSKSQFFNFLASNNFDIEKEFPIFKDEFKEVKMFVDETHRQFAFLTQKIDDFFIYSFDDLVTFVPHSSTRAQLKGNAGSAIVGGLFFGVVGAVVGSSVSQKINVEYHSLQIRVILNHYNNKELVFNFIDRILPDTSIELNGAMSRATAICNRFDQILKLRAANNTFYDPQNAFYNPQNPANREKTEINNADINRLREYKKLLDDGILTQEEFQSYKQQILNK